MSHASYHAETLQVSDEVRAALAANQPLVALESALITHGLPYPQNLETSRELEAAVRDAAAIPATIALIAGRCVIGLSAAQCEALAKRDTPARKISVRDLPTAIAQQSNGGTTVAATMRLAHLAGLRIFATGGIGGVTRGAPFDISADLIELGRTPIAVVCAGAKSILDLPATLEVLETQGVPVIGYGTSELPAFFARSSGLPLAARMDSPAEIASAMQAADQLGLHQGMVIANPIPEDAALAGEAIEAHIAQALADAEAEGVRGAALTPAVLSRVAKLSAGESINANRALLLNNARLASAIAIELSKLDASATSS